MHWADEAACQATAQALAQRPALRDAFVELHGTLGAGKTTFARHLLQALGVQGRIKSPTYAVLESYEVAGLAISHFDFYRFKDPQEFEDAGFRDVFAAAGIKIAEWPEQAEGLLPVADLRVELIPLDGDERRVIFTAQTPRGSELLPDAGPPQGGQSPLGAGAKRPGGISS
ncbi:tRNA (adenosine(37)-N6)-threonylcarbamoyltransferase complex ATPase subunit type 1 TsaE [Piscinibacter sp. HJYY11]|nr:tRNA (adenosine(37)-N6)-threonylcarbamoyltransferase complex ATPase subunit type 1 TsaE [Piscinibacter sp. HJYY11]